MADKRFLVTGGYYDIKWDMRIADLNKVNKTKEDFWDEEEERYDMYKYYDYLHEKNAFLTDEDADKLLNGLDNSLKEAVKINRELWERLDTCLDYRTQYLKERRKVEALIRLCDEFNLNWLTVLDNVNEDREKLELRKND